MRLDLLVAHVGLLLAGDFRRRTGLIKAQPMRRTCVRHGHARVMHNEMSGVALGYEPKQRLPLRYWSRSNDYARGGAKIFVAVEFSATRFIFQKSRPR